MSVRINGIAHIQLTVLDAERCLPFWERLCKFMGMETLIKGDDVIYHIGGRTGILVRQAPKNQRTGDREESLARRFDQDRAGLHHFCFRARSREDVDAIHKLIEAEPDATIVHGPEEGDHFAPGYYSILFEDPDGIRVEVNFVPGRGHFGSEGQLGSGAGPRKEYYSASEFHGRDPDE
jgi:catechol 2,3-dioxygenase-like lactoylglutathione lyase family enzyme